MTSTNKIQTLNKLAEKDLIYFGERSEPYFASHLIISGMQDKKLAKRFFGWNHTVRWIQLNYFFFQFKTDQNKVWSELKQLFYSKGPSYTNALIKNCIATGNRTISLSKKLSAKAKGEKDPKKLARLLEQYFQTISHYTIFYNLAMFEKPIMEIAQEAVKRYVASTEDINKLLDLITAPSRKNAAEFEQEAFLKIASQPKKKQLSLAKKHAEKFGWLSTLFFLGDKWTTEDVMKRLRLVNADKAKKLLQEKQAKQKHLEKNIAKAILPFKPKDKNIIKLVREAVFLRTKRADILSESASAIRPLLDTIASYLKVSYTDLVNLSTPEIILALGGHFDYKTHIAKRKKNILILHNYGQNIVLEAEEVEQFIKNRPILKNEAENVNSLKGMAAFLGKVSGKAKLVKSNNDLAKVAYGDILVAVMTTPNFMPALEKAAGFVTDEGGLTCHAAIVAREMKKPCITGTKTATKIFKDGDMLEVDANNGIVKKL